MKIIRYIRNYIRFWKEILLTIGSLRSFYYFIFPKKIPFIIINYNQLFYLQKLVDFAKIKRFKKIVIIDNLSTFPPLLDYYQSIEKTVCIERMNKNYGHMVLFENQHLYQKYCKSFFLLSDADIVPNKDLPKNFLRVLLHWLLKMNRSITKVGFALDIETIPDSFLAKEKVLKWEAQYWETEIKKDIFYAYLDTTFALYKPDPKKYFEINKNIFFKALRFAGKYTAKHGGWYVDSKNPNEEQKYYIESSSISSSWLNKDSVIYNN